MTPWPTIAGPFVDACAAILPIMNPLGCALLYPQMTKDLTPRQRTALARRVALNAGATLLVAIWTGAALLSFFGISLGALRIAGGLVVAVQGWRLLSDASADSDRTGADAAAFVPLTIPFTTGPGTLAAAMALGTAHPAAWTGFFSYFLGLSAAAIAMAATVAVLYSSADRITALLGRAKAHALARLAAFMLLCVGVEIVLHGARDAVMK